MKRATFVAAVLLATIQLAQAHTPPFDIETYTCADYTHNWDEIVAKLSTLEPITREKLDLLNEGAYALGIIDGYLAKALRRDTNRSIKAFDVQKYHDLIQVECTEQPKKLLVDYLEELADEITN